MSAVGKAETAAKDRKKPALTIMPSFRRSKRKKILAIELGKWSTKAVHLEVQPEGFKLLNYVLQPAPSTDQSSFRAGLPGLLQGIHKACGADTKRIVLCLSVADAIARNVEMPNAPVSQLRRILKLNPQAYLQQDARNYYFDCCTLNSGPGTAPAPAPATPAKLALPAPAEGEAGPKVVPLPAVRKQLSVLVAGATHQLVNDLQSGCAEAGLVLEEITLSQVALANRAVFGQEEGIHANVVALIDIGFANSTISILSQGEVALTRVIAFGGDQITTGLARMMEANYRVAEAIKVTLPQKVEDNLKTVLGTLCQELRTAIDFFEKQYEIPVAEGLISGASARSSFFIQMLETELRVPCKAWNPTSGLGLDLPPNQVTELELNSPQLGPVIGAAQSWLRAPKLPINLLAEKQEEQQERSRDPVRWTFRAAALAVILMLTWATVLAVERANKFIQLNMIERKLNSLVKNSRDVSQNVHKISEMQTTLDHLKKLRQNRFLWTGPLDALQTVAADHIQIVRLQINQTMVTTPPTKPTTLANGLVLPGKPAAATEQLSMVIGAKNYGDFAAAQSFIRSISESPYFKAHLRSSNPVLLKDRLPEQADPLNPNITFSLFTIECSFAPRIITDE